MRWRWSNAPLLRCLGSPGMDSLSIRTSRPTKSWLSTAESGDPCQRQAKVPLIGNEATKYGCTDCITLDLAFVDDWYFCVQWTMMTGMTAPIDFWSTPRTALTLTVWKSTFLSAWRSMSKNIVPPSVTRSTTRSMLVICHSLSLTTFPWYVVSRNTKTWFHFIFKITKYCVSKMCVSKCFLNSELHFRLLYSSKIWSDSVHRDFQGHQGWWGIDGILQLSTLRLPQVVFRAMGLKGAIRRDKYVKWNGFFLQKINYNQFRQLLFHILIINFFAFLFL